MAGRYLTETIYQPDGYWCADCSDLVIKDHPTMAGIKAYMHVDGCMGHTLPRFTPLAVPEPVDPKADG